MVRNGFCPSTVRQGCEAWGNQERERLKEGHTGHFSGHPALSFVFLVGWGGGGEREPAGKEPAGFKLLFSLSEFFGTHLSGLDHFRGLHTKFGCFFGTSTQVHLISSVCRLKPPGPSYSGTCLDLLLPPLGFKGDLSLLDVFAHEDASLLIYLVFAHMSPQTHGPTVPPPSPIAP